MPGADAVGAREDRAERVRLHRLLRRPPGRQPREAAEVGVAGGGELRIGDVAKAAFASTRLLQRNFKDVTGRTVGDALRDERLRRVRALLSETTTPIGAVAGLCGFKSDGYLKQLFRARHGCTMRDWRRRAQGGR